jgi:DNA-binding NarL/FixJ family response regulator
MGVPYQIVLADDHTLFREGLRRILSERIDLEVVGEAADSSALLSLLRRSTPDLVVLDLSIPTLGGIGTTREIKRMYPRLKVLILTMHKSDEYLSHALSNGANGYSLKEDAMPELLSAIETIMQGGVYISPLLSGQCGNGQVR